MLYSEFTKLVGFEVDDRYYNDVVEHEYCESDIDKQEWCKQWKKNGGIQKAYDWMKKQKDNYQSLFSKYCDDLNACIDERNELRHENHELKNEVAGLNRKIENWEQGRKELVEFMIDRSEAMTDPELRLRCINMVGPKEYIRYKMEQGYNLWELDKELILNNMK